MKTIERIFIKLIIIQFLFLIGAQIIIHELDLFPDLKVLTKYEGIGNVNIIEMENTPIQ